MIPQIKQIETLIDQFIESHPNIYDAIGYSVYTYDNHYIPRVTAIIHRCIHDDGLMQWANYLGWKHQSYEQILTNSAIIGTQCHKLIDEYIDTQAPPDVTDIIPEASMGFASFAKWYKDKAERYNVNVISHERTLSCKYFGGTLDGLIQINNKTFLIDYKTGNHIGFTYCMQLAAYAYMLEKLTSYKLDGVLLIQLCKQKPDYNEFGLRLDNEVHATFFNDCMYTYLCMVLYYYQLINLEFNYTSIGWPVYGNSSG